MEKQFVVALSFEFSQAEQALVVYREEVDGSREPIAYLYNMLQVDHYALELEVYGLGGSVDALRLVARGRWQGLSL